MLVDIAKISVTAQVPFDPCFVVRKMPPVAAHEMKPWFSTVALAVTVKRLGLVSVGQTNDVVVIQGAMAPFYPRSI